MVNYSKWDTIGDSDEDEVSSELREKCAVAPPLAPPRNPKAEVLLEEGNRMVNALLARNNSQMITAEERAAYGDAATTYQAALAAMETEEAALSARLHLNVATCHWQASSFREALAAAKDALHFTPGDARAREICDACEAQLRSAAQTGGVDHHKEGEKALDAKDFARAATHYEALSLQFKGCRNADEIHALAHLALAYVRRSPFSLLSRSDRRRSG